MASVASAESPSPTSVTLGHMSRPQLHLHRSGSVTITGAGAAELSQAEAPSVGLSPRASPSVFGSGGVVDGHGGAALTPSAAMPGAGAMYMDPAMAASAGGAGVGAAVGATSTKAVLSALR